MLLHINWLNIVMTLLGFFRCVRICISYEVEVISEPHELGEGPHWDHERQHLYYVNVFNSTIHRYMPAEKRETYCKVDPSAFVSIVIPVNGTADEFLVTIGRNLTIVKWDGESSEPEAVRVIQTVDDEPGKERNHFNDGKVDPAGRLWAGTMGFVGENGDIDKEKGSLYSFPRGGSPVKHADRISVSNGLAWSEDLKSMYYIDSVTGRVDIFDYDSVAGQISNRRPFFDFGPDEGYGPDGMTIDRDGNLWVAGFGAAAVYNIDGRTGGLIRKVELPSKQITSVAFGGPNLDELYVVSANFLLREEDKEKYPKSGCTFRVTGLGAKGYPALPYYPAGISNEEPHRLQYCRPLNISLALYMYHHIVELTVKQTL